MNSAYRLVIICICLFSWASLNAASIDRINRPSRLLRNHQIEVNFFKLFEKGGKQAILSEVDRPWSGSYWPFARGLIANRYSWGKPGTSLEDFFNRYQRVYPPYSIIEDEQMRKKLSPSEKYDLLISGKNGGFPFTKFIWKKSQRLKRTVGRFQGWEGLCNGWAQSSTLYPRPSKALQINSIDGYPVHFYPDDLKALATYYMGEDYSGYRYLGRQCKKSLPPKDQSNRRYIDRECFDVNPGSLHIMLYNALGIGDRQGKKMSFLMEKDKSRDVWNHPVIGYEIEYMYNFERQSLERFPFDEAGKLKPGMVGKLTDIKNDRLSRWRSEDTEYIAEITLNIIYLSNTDPLPLDLNLPKDDNVNYFSVNYQLELDGQYNIIGGEWLLDNHPDFLWMPANDLFESDKAVAEEEAGSNSDLPSLWFENANMTAADGTIYGPMLYQLLKLAR